LLRSKYEQSETGDGRDKNVNEYSSWLSEASSKSLKLGMVAGRGVGVARRQRNS